MSGLETVAPALFPASRSPAVPLSAGGLASQTLQQPNSDKTTRLLSTLPRQRRRGRERPRTDKHSPLGFDSLSPPPPFYPSSTSSFGPAPFPPRARRHSRPHFLCQIIYSTPSSAHIPHLLFFLFGCRRSRGNFEVAPMTGGREPRTFCSALNGCLYQ